HQAMGATMHLGSRLCAWGFNEAEYLSGALIEPVLEILYSKFFLCLNVGCVGTRDCFSRQSIYMMMDVHVERHSSAPLSFSTARSGVLGPQVRVQYEQHTTAPMQVEYSRST